MIRVDFQVKLSNNQHRHDFKVKAIKGRDELFKNVITYAIRKWLEKRLKASGGDPIAVSDDDVDIALGKVISIECNGSDLTDEFEDADATLGEMDSPRTPISEGFDVIVKWTLADKKTSEPAKKKYKYGAHDVLLKKVAMDMKYLEKVIDPDVDEKIDGQIITFLYSFFAEKNMGYVSPQQKKQLRTNSMKLKNVMCFIEKHWKLLMLAEFPVIVPAKSFM